MTTTTGTATELDGQCIYTIRTLCIDAIQSANSGHPGTPIGIAPVTYTLWQRFLRLTLRPDLAEPRSLRALGRTRVCASVVDAAPDGCPGRRPRV